MTSRSVKGLSFPEARGRAAMRPVWRLGLPRGAAGSQAPAVFVSEFCFSHKLIAVCVFSPKFQSSYSFVQ